MAALTGGGTNRAIIDMETARYPVAAAENIPAGALVSIDASGFAVGASDTAGEKVVGVALKRADNSAGGAAELYVSVLSGGSFLFDGTFASTDVKLDAEVLDNNTVATSGSTNSVKAGQVAEVLSATRAKIFIPHTGPAV